MVHTHANEEWFEIAMGVVAEEGIHEVEAEEETLEIVGTDIVKEETVEIVEATMDSEVDGKFLKLKD